MSQEKSSSSRLTQFLKKVTRFRIASLLIFTGLVAFSICAFRGQFNPAISCQGLETNLKNPEIESEDSPRVAVLNIKNRGWFPMWYMGNGEVSSVNLLYRNSSGDMSFDRNSASQNSWTAFWPGDSVRLNFAIPENSTRGQVGFLLMDWRGNKYSAWTEELEFELARESLDCDWREATDSEIGYLW